VVARLDPARANMVQARLLDVATGKWARPSLAVALADAPARVAGYASLAPDPPKLNIAAPAPPTASKAGGLFKIDTSVPAWKRWYTWVAGAVLLGGVVALLVATHVGSDQVTIDVMH
jgi:hypothetical protein